MRVLANIRLSRETDESTSPQRQRAGLTSWADSLGHTIIGWAEDLDVSGGQSPWDRPDLGKWLTDRPPADYDIIASTKIDRISRDLGDFVGLIDWANKRGKYVVAYMDSVDTSTPTGELVAKVLAIFAEFERKTIAARNVDSRKLATSEGRYHGGLPPFGYKIDKHPSGKGFILVPDETAVAILNEIIQWCRDGDSMNAICARLNERGVLTPTDYFRQSRGKPTKGNRWAPTSLRDIIGSKALLGISVTKDDKIIYGEDGLPLQKADPAILRQDWNDLQRYLETVARPGRRTLKTSPLLGVVFCLKCGRPAYRVTTRTGEYYRCGALVDGSKACAGRSFKGAALSEIVEKGLLEHVGDLEIMEEVYIPGESHSEALQDATAAWDDLQEQSAGKPKAVQDLYQKKIAMLEERIAALSELPESAPRTELRPTGRTYREAWGQADEQGRRKLLLSAGVRVEATLGEGDWVSVGRFERPNRYDEAILVGIHERIHYAYWLPVDLVARVTRQSAN